MLTLQYVAQPHNATIKDALLDIPRNVDTMISAGTRLNAFIQLQQKITESLKYLATAIKTKNKLDG